MQMLQLSIFLLGLSHIIQIGRERKMGDGIEVYMRKCVSYWVADSFGVTEIGRVLGNEIEMEAINDLSWC